MDGTWIEVRVITKSEALEPISGIFYSLDCKGVAIEDPEDILGREQGPLTWDFADINVLEHKGKVAVVKAYFAEEDNIEDVLEYVNERLTELKEMGLDLGEAKVEHEKMHEEDAANTWKQYYKPTKVGEKIVVKSSDFENEINVTYPNGDIKGLKSGEEVNGELALGIYKINQNNNNESFSVNFPTSSESDTSVETIGENDNIVHGKSNLKSGFNLTPIFILLAMLVVAFEWILYKKGN